MHNSHIYLMIKILIQVDKHMNFLVKLDLLHINHISKFMDEQLNQLDIFHIILILIDPILVDIYKY